MIARHCCWSVRVFFRFLVLEGKSRKNLEVGWVHPLLNLVHLYPWTEVLVFQVAYTFFMCGKGLVMPSIWNTAHRVSLGAETLRESLRKFGSFGDLRPLCIRAQFLKKCPVIDTLICHILPHCEHIGLAGFEL